ncbi:MAG: SUMF1/EgtB/PvdO family nonheme iron enzyme [Deltaproteobacteria bacterium]|nr:SUMF1/EgtB/PvdO family nonheme iron enzyme [Deltaproteobacteria bacterium]
MSVRTIDSFCIARREITRGDWQRCITAGACQTLCVESCSAEKAKLVGYCDACLTGDTACGAADLTSCLHDDDARKVLDGDSDETPVRYVLHREAQHFCSETATGGRLPTAAEWAIATWSAEPCYRFSDEPKACGEAWPRFPWGNEWTGHNGSWNLGVHRGGGPAVTGPRRFEPGAAILGGIADGIGNVAEMLSSVVSECTVCVGPRSVRWLVVGGSYNTVQPEGLDPRIGFESDPDVGFRCVIPGQ